MKKVITIIVSIFLLIGILWSLMAIIDYTRSKDLKPPLFDTSIELNQHGAGFYHCIGYDVWAVSNAFNGGEHVLYDMEFILFGRGNGVKRTIHDNYHKNYALLGEDKETVINYLEALKVVTPDVSGKQERYTEYVNGNDVKVMNLTFHNGVMSGFEYEYHNHNSAYEFASYLREELEMTFGEKNTYPGNVQENKDYFDNVQDVSELKSQCTYYEDWTMYFEGDEKEKIYKMLDGRDCSRIDMRFELSVIDENKAIVSVKYIAVP